MYTNQLCNQILQLEQQLQTFVVAVKTRTAEASGEIYINERYMDPLATYIKSARCTIALTVVHLQ